MTNLTHLTELLEQNPDVAGRLESVACGFADSILPVSPDRRELAGALLTAAPDSYFSEALARVADVMGKRITTAYPGRVLDHPKGRYEAVLRNREQPQLAIVVEYARTPSQALRALWVAILTEALKPCEECGGRGKVEDTDAGVRFQRDCHFCNGTGRKMPKVIEALVG